jgi:hypothetical protein
MVRRVDDTVQLKLRFKENLRARLEQSARRHEASLNSEIVHRLEQSFQEEAGSPETTKLLRLIGSMISLAEQQTGKSWASDLKTWSAVQSAIAKILSDNEPGTAAGLHSEEAAAKEEAMEALAAARRELEEFENEHPLLRGWRADNKGIAPIAIPEELRTRGEALRDEYERARLRAEPFIDVWVSGQQLGIQLALNEKGFYRLRHSTEG